MKTADTNTHRQLVRIPPVSLEGELTLPEESSALVIFAHGAGSSRHSPRNRFVAQRLNAAGLSTLLIDLLTSDEERETDLRFDIPLLARRVIHAIDWAADNAVTKQLPIVLFGASAGAAAALVASAKRCKVAAVVSRGGRPDLAGPALMKVHAPTLLLVGGRDRAVLELNRKAQQHLAGSSELVVVPGATHLFDEPGTLEQVAAQTARWVVRQAKTDFQNPAAAGRCLALKPRSGECTHSACTPPLAYGRTSCV